MYPKVLPTLSEISEIHSDCFMSSQILFCDHASIHTYIIHHHNSTTLLYYLYYHYYLFVKKKTVQSINCHNNDNDSPLLIITTNKHFKVLTTPVLDWTCFVYLFIDFYCREPG